MPTLQELKAQRTALEAAIKRKEKEEAEKVKAGFQRLHCAKIVCLTCRGSGETERGGVDILSDPPYNETCDECLGSGFIFAVLHDRGLQKYDLLYDERQY